MKAWCYFQSRMVPYFRLDLFIFSISRKVMFMLAVTTNLIFIFAYCSFQSVLTISAKIHIIIGHRANMTSPFASKKESKCIIPQGYSTADKAFLKEQQFTPEGIYPMGCYVSHQQ